MSVILNVPHIYTFSLVKDISNEQCPPSRSFLVGAQTQRLFSKDGAVVKVDVQFGNIEVNLTP